MIKTVIATIASILSLLLSVSAQDTDALLWKISGNDFSQPSYLFGTIHLMCPDDIQITQPMRDALQNTKQVVLEIDMDEPGIMQNMQSIAMMADGTTLNDLLTEDEYQLVGNYLQDSLQIPIQALNAMKPLMLSTFTFLDVLNCQPGSYEMQLVQQAKEQQKEVLGLETLEDQAQAFDFIPLEEQADYLVDAIQNYDETVFEIEAILAAYQSEQVEHLYNITHESMQEMEGAEESLLTKRNQNWIPLMEEIAQDQPTFFAVGAAHLGGPMGVIALLKEQGYTVEAVSSIGQ
ncbi:MAG: TraB/GumN family protein [Tunicatimonas sp.]|uniref:TraB/GumN family protein n=1 Tax=Tunicatimonas sp. TaxID=1940096 RepID=UPI003C770456